MRACVRASVCLRVFNFWNRNSRAVDSRIAALGLWLLKCCFGHVNYQHGFRRPRIRSQPITLYRYARACTCMRTNTDSWLLWLAATLTLTARSTRGRSSLQVCALGQSSRQGVQCVVSGGNRFREGYSTLHCQNRFQRSGMELDAFRFWKLSQELLGWDVLDSLISSCTLTSLRATHTRLKIHFICRICD